MAGYVTLHNARQLQMVAFRADLSRYTGSHPRGIYFLTDTGAALIWTHPDHRWVVSLPCAVGDRDPQMTVREVLGVPDLAVEVIGANHWTAAAQYSQGPVFLVGDVFCAVLAWSRFRFVRFAADEKAATTLGLLAECLETIGGVPKTMLADRMGCL
jgi:hypothetical protein